jgi:hypothetical protein
MPDQQTVTVSLGLGELVDSNVWEVMRRDIQWDGAPGVFDGFGTLSIKVNGHPVMVVTVHEDGQGRVVVGTQPVATDGHPYGMETVIEVERNYGLVPPRPDGSVSKRERWGG